MEEFIAYLVKNLVSFPSKVHVSSSEENGKIHIEINVAAEDIGKVIGRQGNTINALRTIVRTVGIRLGRHVYLELIQPTEKVPSEKLEEVSCEV
jgi:predicted RNA-binding protein YlqC (UPF0109 family)